MDNDSIYSIVAPMESTWINDSLSTKVDLRLEMNYRTMILLDVHMLPIETFPLPCSNMFQLYMQCLMPCPKQSERQFWGWLQVNDLPRSLLTTGKTRTLSVAHPRINQWVSNIGLSKYSEAFWQWYGLDFISSDPFCNLGAVWLEAFVSCGAKGLRFDVFCACATSTPIHRLILTTLEESSQEFTSYFPSCLEASNACELTLSCCKKGIPWVQDIDVQKIDNKKTWKHHTIKHIQTYIEHSFPQPLRITTKNHCALGQTACSFCDKRKRGHSLTNARTPRMQTGASMSSGATDAFEPGLTWWIIWIIWMIQWYSCYNDIHF